MHRKVKCKLGRHRSEEYFYGSIFAIFSLIESAVIKTVQLLCRLSYCFREMC